MPGIDSGRPVLVVTPTYERPGRMALLARCLATFRRIAGLHWILVEDGTEADQDVVRMLAQSGISHDCLAVGPTRRWGNAQRDLALRHIRDRALDGVVYLADDDNYYEEPLFAELRKVRRVGVLPVGLLGPFGIERPILRHGRIVGWRASWTSRRFPLDMAAFAFDARLLRQFDGPIWTYQARGGETEFLERLIGSADELEILCDGCRRCHVWHDLRLNRSVTAALAAYRLRRCAAFMRRASPTRLLQRRRTASQSEKPRPEQGGLG